MKKITVNNRRYVMSWAVWNGLDKTFEAMFLRTKKEAEAIIRGLINTELGDEYKGILQPVKIFSVEFPRSEDEFLASDEEKLVMINKIFKGAETDGAV